MKRKRPRSERRPRAFENKGLRDLYRRHHPYCEACALIPGHRGQCLSAVVVHHIWRGGLSQRPDLWSNFISVCEDAHRWCHDNEAVAKLICTAYKVSRNEFNRTRMREAIGRDAIGVVIGMDERGELGMESWVEPLVLELKEAE